MTQEALASVFADAAPPQKVAFIILTTALLASFAGIILGLRRHPVNRALWRGMTNLRCAGPLLGLLTGALDGYQMAHTIQRLPSAPSLKDLAPGILEVSALLSLGAFTGLCAGAACLLLTAGNVNGVTSKASK